MPSIPDAVSSRGRRAGVPPFDSVRRVSLMLLAVLVAFALANGLGARATTTAKAASDATLSVYAPQRVRSGLAYTARFRIDAATELKDATLVLSSGWTEGYTVQGSAPLAREGNRNGRITYSFGSLPAGDHLTFYLSLRVDPSNVGLRTADVELDDGDSEILTVYRNILVLP